MHSMLMTKGVGIMPGFPTPGGGRLLTTSEAAALWNSIAEDPISETTYRRMCQAGKLAGWGVRLSQNGTRLLTDADSMLDYWKRRVQGVSERLGHAVEERERDRAELLRTERK